MLANDEGLDPEPRMKKRRHRGEERLGARLIRTIFRVASPGFNVQALRMRGPSLTSDVCRMMFLERLNLNTRLCDIANPRQNRTVYVMLPCQSQYEYGVRTCILVMQTYLYHFKYNAHSKLGFNLTLISWSKESNEFGNLLGFERWSWYCSGR